MRLLHPFRKHKWLWGCAAVLVALAWWQISGFRPDEQKELRQRVRESVIEAFPEEAAEFSRTMGLFPFPEEGGEPGVPAPGRPSVVLVHGLDDPGKVWRSLAPALAGKGCDVWLMEYPNDQPIADSSRLFFQELKGLRSRGVRRIDIVGHSMGGLVARELLTGPGYDFKGAARRGEVPAVGTLVLVAVPNHGSQLARFRVFAEWRDQLGRLITGRASWLSPVLDGMGGAKLDLLPDSRFLAELNARPHPEGVEMFSIAGMTSPWTGEEIERWIETLGAGAAEDGEDFKKLKEAMARMADGLGDGLVTVESTRLDGVPHITLKGTHLSIIRNLLADSDRVPPAVPIIVDLLTRVPRPWPALRTPTAENQGQDDFNTKYRCPFHPPMLMPSQAISSFQINALQRFP